MMKAKEQNREIKEAFRQLEANRFASSFTLSLHKQFRKNKVLSERQMKALFEIRDSLKVEAGSH